jgi:Fe-Mn family superoxide dismutase
MSDSRRDFFKKSALLGLAGLAGNLVSEEKLKTIEEIASLGSFTEITLPELPYAYDALEPFIDKQTMEIHHKKHHQAYIDKLNIALKGFKNEMSITGLFSEISKSDSAIRNNGGGHYNHSLFWQLMKANPTGIKLVPEGKISESINRDFQSFENFQKEFTEKATKNFGSGWCWLIEQNGKLIITTTANQDNPLMDLVAEKGKPLLALDIWEHAYYLKYQNKRADYINNWWNVVNWNKVNELYTTK